MISDILPNIVDWTLFFRWLGFSLCLAVFIIYLTPAQLKETVLPFDRYSKLRWIVLGILLLIVFTLVPVVTNLYFLMQGIRYEILADISAIAGTVTILGLTGLFVLVFRYNATKDD